MRRLIDTFRTSALRRTALATLAFVCASFAMVGTASAQQLDAPDQSLYFGIYGGGHLSPGDQWDVSDSKGNRVNPGSTGITAFRIGGHILEWFAMEGSLGILPNVTVGEERNTMLKYDADLVFQPVDYYVRPYALIGGGMYQHIDGDNDSDFDYNAHYGIGFSTQFTKWLGLRVEARHILTDGRGTDDVNIANNVEVYAGLNFFAMYEHENYLADSDEDGIVDSEDLCADLPGDMTASGCPDADRDTIANNDDACPNVKGVAATAGCPDADGDLIIDSQDDCPHSPGVRELNGCRDSDGDTIVDSKDECPMLAGDTTLGGCPDTDGDRVADKNDPCPKVAGPAPGVACPEQPKEVIYTFIGAIEGVHFAYDKAELRPDSFTVLDTTARSILAALEANPNLRLEIQGHTDDQGGTDYNHDLSHRRAQTVRGYLVSKGVPAANLVATGYGESMPKASNDTKDGRALNRRVEIQLVK